MYITYEEFAALWGGGVSQEEFQRLGFRAQRVMDELTTGVDGVRKLAVAMPAEPYARECVARCMGALIRLMDQVERTREAGAASKQENGALASSGVVTALSSGTESMTFASGSGVSSAIREAAGSVARERELYAATVREYLSGIEDANGVRLLFGGRYPLVLRG